ncbi:MAG: MOP flippase family protein [Methylomonas sp.]|jgi:PST family polysaccharide transporter
MNLKKQVLSGAKWNTVANVFKQILQLLSLVVYARLLSPDDFGLFSILMIFVSFLTLFSDMGMSAALVHIQNPSNKLFSSVFYFNIFVGFVLCITLIILTTPISIFFDNAKLKELLPLISISFVIYSFGIVQRAIYNKQLNFKKITLIETTAATISIFIGIGLAYYGFGIYSLVFQALINGLMTALFLRFTGHWRPLAYFSLKDIKSIWQYTANLSSFNVINYFARNADNFLIGKVLGTVDLGVYNLAYKIMLYPVMNVSQVLIQVLFPAFSKIQNDNEKIKKAYLRVIFFISLVTFPLMAGLFATADLFVKVVFGDKWQNLANLLMILTPIGLFQSIVTTAGSIFMSKGNTKNLFIIGSINSVIFVTSFVIGLPYGIEGVAISYLIANLIVVCPTLKYAWQQIGLSVFEGFRTLAPVLLFSLLMVAVVFEEKYLLRNIVSDLILLIISIIIGAIAFVIPIHLKYGGFKRIISELR